MCGGCSRIEGYVVFGVVVVVVVVVVVFTVAVVGYNVSGDADDLSGYNDVDHDAGRSCGR